MEVEVGIFWLKPIIVDGVIRWPPCEEEVTDPQARAYREDDDTDCALSAKVNYRGVMLCKRHAAKRLLSEFVEDAPLQHSAEGSRDA